MRTQQPRRPALQPTLLTAPLVCAAQAAAAAALLDQDYFKSCTEQVIKTREKTLNALTNLGFDVKESEANFLFCIPPLDAQLYTEKVKEGGFLIRYFKIAGIDNYVRISIGSDEEMNQFIELTEAIIKEHK